MTQDCFHQNRYLKKKAYLIFQMRLARLTQGMEFKATMRSRVVLAPRSVAFW